MNLYQIAHGNLDTGHTLRPQFRVQNNRIFPTIYNATATRGTDMPWFEIKGSRVYKTNFHPEGHSTHPVYEVRGNELHNTIHHPEGLKPTAAFQMRH